MTRSLKIANVSTEQIKIGHMSTPPFSKKAHIASPIKKAMKTRCGAFMADALNR
jgi:hypothetical protein